MTPTRLDNVVENIIWAANGNEIKYVISNGEILVDNYQFTKVNLHDILRQIQELSEMFYEFKSRKDPKKATGVRGSG